MKNEIRILHILNDLNPSGAEVMLEVASKYWIEHGILGYILATGENVGSYAEQLKKSGYQIYHIPLKLKLLFIIKLFKLIKKNKFDIIHIHSEGASLYSAIASKISKRQNVIRTVHHIWPKKRILPYMKRKVFRFITNKVFKIVSVSNSYSGRENEKMYYNCDNLLIPNWYDEIRYQPLSFQEKNNLRRKYNISESEIVVASLGGNWPYKNYWMIIEALSHLPSIVNIKYFQIGPEGDEKPLQNIANKLNVKNKVYFWGKVYDVLPLLQMSDYYIMPSSEEGFGNAAIEAMGTGLIPILADVKALCDFKKYYNNIKDIIWIRPNVTDIVNVFKNIYTSKRYEIYKQGKILHSITKNKFGVSVGAKEYLKLYKSLIV